MEPDEFSDIPRIITGYLPTVVIANLASTVADVSGCSEIVLYRDGGWGDRGIAAGHIPILALLL